jgi:hypothetical protein
MNKEEQKQLIVDIMNADAKDGLYKQQTAVEWLINAVEANMGDIPLEVQEQAKEMEKEQHENTWYAGDEDGVIFAFEYYWNETYGGNK